MKAVLLMNEEYFRKLNVSATICAEFGEPLEKGDVLYDIVSHHKYEISGRGFRPKRSPATADRLHWSRETSLSIVGRCDSALGRILVDESGLSHRWAHFVCHIEHKSGLLPVDVPIIGKCRATNDWSPGLMILRDSTVEVVCPQNGETEAALAFSCFDVSGHPVEVRLNISETRPITSSGNELSWSDADSECSLA
jgi:hypothetical protein